MTDTKFNILIYSLPIGLLLIALIEGLPYGYFQFLRIIIALFSCLVIYVNFNIYKDFIRTHYLKHIAKTALLFVCLFGVIFILFNPIFPIYFKKNIWKFIDLSVAIIIFLNLVLNIYFTKKIEVTSDVRNILDRFIGKDL